MVDSQTYTSPSAFEDVVTFYQEEMPKQGWAAGEEGMQMEGLSMFSFVKDGERVQVMISYDQDSELTSVMITAEQ